MLKIVKAGGLTVGTGVVVGLLGVGFLHLTRPDGPVANSNGGIVPLDQMEATPTPPPEGGLTVVPSSNGQSGAGSGTSSGGGSGMTLGSGTTSTGSSSGATSRVPGPSEFHQYDEYASSPTGMYGDIRTGDGREVAMGSTVVVNYRGWLTDGTLFDESYSKGTGFTFVEGDHRVIAGWEEGLLGMKAGGKRRVIVPPGAGYGSEAHGPIPGGSVLVFDIELLEVK